MKTYNTIEDILNDHELMQLDVNELGKWLDSYLNNNSLTFFFKEYSMREAEWLKSEYERRQKEKPMKTYNTIEDIINDHELMAKSVEDIFNFIFDVSAELFKSMNGFYSEKTEWLKSEYERRQKEKSGDQIIAESVEQSIHKDKFLSHDGTNQHFAEQNFKPMEKKLNLIPFDLEKAKAGAKVWVFYAGEYLEANIAKDDLPSDLSIIYWFVKVGYGCITLRCDKDGKFENNQRLFIESEPLLEMFSVEIPKDISWQKLFVFYVDSEYGASDNLSDILKSFVKSLN